jgi:2-dehydro-3-deoxygluconokinase
VSDAPLIVGLGEAMLRLSPPGPTPLVDARTLDVHVAGAELNVLVAASALGARGRFLTRVPDGDLAEIVQRHALARGVEVVGPEEVGARLGLFFLETGSPPRASRVRYDRRDSAASHLTPDDVDWPSALAGAAAAHATGITLALGEGPAAAVVTMFQVARELGVTTSFDPNYRSQLWDLETARRACRAVLAHVDVAFVSPADLAWLTGRDAPASDLARALAGEFDLTTVVVRERVDPAPGLRGVRVWTGEGDDVAEAYAEVVDELGAGDAGAGAFLAARALGRDLATQRRWCARAYARTLTIPGDCFSGDVEDLEERWVHARTLRR